MRRSPWRRTVLYFAVAATTVVVALVLVSSSFSTRAAREEATRDAEALTVFAASFLEPRMTEELLRGDPASVETLDGVIRSRVIGGRILRVKIWSEAGTIVYSDEPRLVGRRYALDDGELQVLRQGGSEAEASDAAKPENVFERDLGELVEVYTRIRGSDGRPMLFEAYFSTADVRASSETIRAGFRPITVAVLLLFLLLSLPVVAWLASRLGRAADERERLLQAAVDASDQERRRLARDLHDGVVQDLAGTAFELAGLAGRIPPDDGAEVGRLAGQVRAGIRSLRSLLVTLYPPDLTSGGLASALGDLVAPAVDAGVECEIDVPDTLDVGQDVVHLLWRVCNEAVRNALAHASPAHLRIRVERVDDRVRLEVVDDGHGFDATTDPPEGHLGLRLLDDLVRDHGGVLQVHGVPGHGTTVAMEVPV